MNEKLFPYQEIGAKWLASRPHALLADEMGLGKSAQAITACDLVGAKRILVLCPAIGRLNWIEEFQTFSGSENLQSIAAVFTKNERPFIKRGLVCSYNLMTDKKLLTWILSKNWDVLILDEVHYLKNRKAGRTKAVYGELSSLAKFVWALSGTPAPNHGGELYTLLRNFKRYNGDYWTFIKRFCTFFETKLGTTITGTKRIKELRSILEPILLRRRKKDVMKELPPIIYKDYAVEAGPVDMNRWYPQLERKMMTPEGLEKKICEQQAAIDAVFNITGISDDGIAALGGLQAGCFDARKYTGLQKVGSVAEIISEELKSGAYERKVIFCIHQAVVEDLWERLREFNPVIIYGGTPAKKRDKRIREFHKDPKCRILIGNIQAAGIVINLTVAHHVDIIEASWVPSDNAQAIMRLHRIGQEQPVNVRFFYLPKSSDQRVQRAYMRKAQDLTQIFDPNEELVDPFAD